MLHCFYINIFGPVSVKDAFLKKEYLLIPTNQISLHDVFLRIKVYDSFCGQPLPGCTKNVKIKAEKLQVGMYCPPL